MTKGREFARIVGVAGSAQEVRKGRGKLDRAEELSEGGIRSWG